MKNRIITLLIFTFGFFLGYFINSYIEATKIITISNQTSNFLSAEFDIAYWLSNGIKKNKSKIYIDTTISKNTAFYPMDTSLNNLRILVLPKRADNKIIRPFENNSNEVYMVTKDKIFFLKPIPIKIINTLDN